MAPTRFGTLSDGTDIEEVTIHHTNPLDPDTDHDGLNDGNEVRVWGTDKDAVGRLREEIRGRLNLGIGEAEIRRMPAQFVDVVAEALIVPMKGTEEEGARRLLRRLVDDFNQTD